METYKIAWLSGLGALLFIGLIIMMSNVNSHNYYQKQSYNSLPSVAEDHKPAPIQHYEAMRDDSVKATEAQLQNLSACGNGICDKGESQFDCPNDCHMNSVVGLFYNSDGSLSWFFYAMAIVPIVLVSLRPSNY